MWFVWVSTLLWHKFGLDLGLSPKAWGQSKCAIWVVERYDRVSSYLSPYRKGKRLSKRPLQFSTKKGMADAPSTHISLSLHPHYQIKYQKYPFLQISFPPTLLPLFLLCAQNHSPPLFFLPNSLILHRWMELTHCLLWVDPTWALPLLLVPQIRETTHPSIHFCLWQWHQMRYGFPWSEDVRIFRIWFNNRGVNWGM